MNKIKKMKKLIKLLKASPIAMVAVGLLVAGAASAALLTLYGTMKGTADVKQSVVFGNGDTEKTYTIGNSPAVAGNTYTQTYNLLNRSVTTAPISFVTNQCVKGNRKCDGSGYEEEGINTSYWSTVELSTKNTTDWTITDTSKATLTYELMSSKFNYEFEATGLVADESYSLIYYADESDRFENWGGANPGKLIATLTADSDGNISAEGSKNLGINLPHSNDWNSTADANYCNNTEGDNYNLCRGAKIWLVPSEYYNSSEKTVVSWTNADSYLFETDLIVYTDTDADSYLWLSEGQLNFFVKNVLDLALVPQEYEVKTEIVPGN